MIEPAVQTDKGWLSELRLGGGGKLGMPCQQRIPCSCSRNTYSNEGESTRRRDTKGDWDGGAEETGDGSLVEDDARMSLSLSLSPSLVLCCTLDPNRATSGRLLLGFSAANGSGWLAQSESPGARALKTNRHPFTPTHALDLRRVSSAKAISIFEKRGGAILVSSLLWRFSLSP